MAEKRMVRCFVALELPESLKQQLSALLEELRRLDRNRKVRWVRPEGIHLTLKFLGEVPAGQIPDIIAATGSALNKPGIAPFSLLVGKLGVFPRQDAPRVIWIGLDGNLKALNTTYQAVEQALVPLGFPPEKRPFSPHLTLGRVPDISAQEKRNLGQLLLAFPGRTNLGTVKFEEAVLMESVLRGEGALYTPLEHFKFASL